MDLNRKGRQTSCDYHTNFFRVACLFSLSICAIVEADLFSLRNQQIESKQIFIDENYANELKLATSNKKSSRMFIAKFSSVGQSSATKTKTNPLSAKNQTSNQIASMNALSIDSPPKDLVISAQKTLSPSETSLQLDKFRQGSSIYSQKLQQLRQQNMFRQRPFSAIQPLTKPKPEHKNLSGSTERGQVAQEIQTIDMQEKNKTACYWQPIVTSKINIGQQQ